MRFTLLSIFILSTVHTFALAQDLPPVEEDEIGIVERLPTEFPDSWIYVNKSGFPQGGRIMIVDVAAQNFEYKGAVSSGYVSDLAINPAVGEIYIAETYYDRGTRGKRSDMITVYDQATLRAKTEIPLEKGKRFLVGAMKGKFRLINDKKWAMVANYTPAASVSIVDLESEKILSEIPIPGCNLAYPLGKRGFATMCGFGEIISVNLDENGQLIREHQSEPFNDLDNDPHFEKFTRVGDIMYLPTYKGSITGIDLSGDQAVVGETWSLTTEADRDAGWRPGGWQIITSDETGNLYILMHENGYNGSHKDQGSEVWVFDPKLKKRIARHKLKEDGYSILVTKEDTPRLVVSSNISDNLQVYDAMSGEHQRAIMVGPFIITLYSSE